MRAFMPVTLTGGLAAVALLFGCAGGSQGSTLVPSSAAVHLAQAGTASKNNISPDHYLGLRDLYVADLSGGVGGEIKMLRNKTYREIGAISSGIKSPTGVFLDRRGNLYVSNSNGPNILEYAPNTASPSFVYSEFMGGPINVTVDVHGNVFEADGTTGDVNQYFQGEDSVVGQCAPGGASALGVAVDSANDVFVSFSLGNVGAIVEYKGGLAGCHATLLTAPVVFPYGLALDKNSDLVVSDAGSGQVDVIAPPYSSVTRTLGTGFIQPTNTALSMDNKLAFVTDYGARDVQVFDYSTGTLIATLNSVYGLANPYSAVDGPNAVY